MKYIVTKVTYSHYSWEQLAQDCNEQMLDDYRRGVINFHPFLHDTREAGRLDKLDQATQEIE